MTLSGAFAVRQYAAVHVANLTQSSPVFMIALCGSLFDRPVIPVGSQQATCAICRRRDDPFHTGKVPLNPTTWVETLASRRAGQPNGRSALLTRDLITENGVITSRGLLLSQDLTNPTPWVDDRGITHMRLPAGKRLRGACGADLLGIRHINYAKLDKVRATYESAMVDCMTCMTLAGQR